MARPFAVIAASLLLVTTVSLADDPPVPLPAEIISRMVDTYAELQTYRDAISVEVSNDDGESSPRTLLVDTVFQRPDRFRFRLHDDSQTADGQLSLTYVVWSDVGGFRSWAASRPEIINRFDRIDGALGGPTGISYSTAVRIPTLLMPRILWGSGLRHLIDSKLLGEELIGPDDCYVVEATLRRPNRPITLWIDKSTFLVHRWEYDLRGQSGEATHVRATYVAEADPEVYPSEFEFVPPY